MTKARGEQHGRAKLTDSQVSRILHANDVKPADGPLTQKEIAKLFGVSQVTISRISNKKNWKHVT